VGVMDVGTKWGLALIAACIAGAVAVTVYFRHADDEAQRRAIEAADAWLEYASDTRAAACKSINEGSVECVVTKASGVTMTVVCDRGAVFECSPVVERP